MVENELLRKALAFFDRLSIKLCVAACSASGECSMFNHVTRRSELDSLGRFSP